MSLRRVEASPHVEMAQVERVLNRLYHTGQHHDHGAEPHLSRLFLRNNAVK
jgi:hypothetical protein